jgi:hypothetical protein
LSAVTGQDHLARGREVELGDPPMYKRDESPQTEAGHSFAELQVQWDARKRIAPLKAMEWIKSGGPWPFSEKIRRENTKQRATWGST